MPYWVIVFLFVVGILEENVGLRLEFSTKKHDGTFRQEARHLKPPKELHKDILRFKVTFLDLIRREQGREKAKSESTHHNEKLTFFPLEHSSNQTLLRC